ncbi:AcrR family transcriptional regulator [Marmoricola sp. OAE513]|uniref:TetR/AcrR family transcriptional regulator n=1 Tax=Marmoricola sp. OAE513 TaxID=2817894 RepID=UPI001AE4C257
MTEAKAPSRLDQRKARTRAALISAAQTLLAEGRTSVSIQEITDAADVGFGSFYNHFESKEALFEAAIQDTLEVYGEFLDSFVASVEDPAEVFTASFRLSGRLQRLMPEHVRVMLNAGMHVLTDNPDRGLAPRARHDLQAAHDAGRMDVPNIDLALMAVGGALLGLLQYLEANPELDDAPVTDEFTRRVLSMLGVSNDDAEDLVGRPLPEAELVTEVHAL